MGLRIILVILAIMLTAPRAVFADVIDLHDRSAGTDLERIGDHVDRLAFLAKAHIGEVGLRDAILDFQATPWVREANGLHLWGVTVAGMSWFNAGHPELVGLQVSEMCDIEGRYWSRMAVDSATGEGPERFALLFPHPASGKAARGLHRCFMLADQQRVLCAGAFEDTQ